MKLLSLYEDKAATTSEGKEYQECYDVATALPIREHLDMYKKKKAELAALGIEFLF